MGFFHIKVSSSLWGKGICRAMCHYTFMPGYSSSLQLSCLVFSHQPCCSSLTDDMRVWASLEIRFRCLLWTRPPHLPGHCSPSPTETEATSCCIVWLSNNTDGYALHASCPLMHVLPSLTVKMDNLYRADWEEWLKTWISGVERKHLFSELGKGHSEGHCEGWEVDTLPYFLVLLCLASGALKDKALHHLKSWRMRIKMCPVPPSASGCFRAGPGCKIGDGPQCWNRPPGEAVSKPHFVFPDCFSQLSQSFLS